MAEPARIYNDEISDARSVLLEYIRDPEFKRFLNQVVLAQAKGSFRSLAVVSQYPGEGRTTAVAALALAYSEFLRKRVLILDTVSATRGESFFVGKVMSHEWAQAPRPAGESGIDLMSRGGIAHQIHYNQRHLYKELPDGAMFADLPPDRSTMDFHIRYLLDAVRAQYDLILLDTCAMALAGREDMDPVVLAKQAEAALLVLSPLSVERKAVREIRALFERGQVEIIGSIYNPGGTPFA